MKFDQSVAAQIMARIALHLPGGKIGPCPICTQTNWQLQPGFVTTSLSDDPTAITLGGKGLKSVALVCLVCGNTQLMNLVVLGLTNLLSKSEPEQPQEETASPDSK